MQDFIQFDIFEHEGNAHKICNFQRVARVGSKRTAPVMDARNPESPPKQYQTKRR